MQGSDLGCVNKHRFSTLKVTFHNDWLLHSDSAHNSPSNPGLEMWWSWNVAESSNEFRARLISP